MDRAERDARTNKRADLIVDELMQYLRRDIRTGSLIDGLPLAFKQRIDSEMHDAMLRHLDEFRRELDAKPFLYVKA